MGTFIYIAGVVVFFLIGCVVEYLDAKNPKIQSYESMGDRLCVWIVVAWAWPLVLTLGVAAALVFGIIGGLGYFISRLASRSTASVTQNRNDALS